MVKHVILWKLKDMPAEELAAVTANIKTPLEGLAGQIDGLVDIRVYVNDLTSSNVDVMLDSTFENQDALKNYAIHPAHVAVANTYVRPYTATRSCMDFTI